MNDVSLDSDSGCNHSILLPSRSIAEWGYINVNGTTIIQPQFDSTGTCLDGQPYAISDSDLVILSQQGDIIARLKDAWSMHSFQSGRLAFERDDLTGFCNTRGEIVIEPKYLKARPFSELGCSVCVGSSFDESWHRIGANGERLNNYEYNFIRPYMRGENLTGAKMKNQDRFVVINSLGEPVAENEYSDVRCFSEGLAPVKFLNEPGKMGWIDDQLQTVVPGVFDELGDYFVNGLVPARKNGLWGLARRDGTWAFNPKFRFVGNGGDGFWPAVVNGVFVGDLGKSTNTMMTTIDEHGMELSSSRFSHVSVYSKGVAQFFLPRIEGGSARDPIPFGYLSSSGDLIWEETT